MPLSAPLNNAESIYRANLDMKGFHQEVVRVVLLDAHNRCITKVDIERGTVNEPWFTQIHCGPGVRKSSRSL
jgi:DNA repair protein RadC